MEALKIGTVSVMLGETKRGTIPIGSSMYGVERELPIIVIRGKEDGTRLWIAGATHGDEPEGPYSITLLQQSGVLDPQKMKGLVVLVPAMNIEALMGSDRGDPRDNFTFDMNRIYPGKPDGYPTERVAWAYHKEMIEHCDIHLNIHSGGDHSMLDTAYFASETPASLELAKAMGAEWDLALTSGTGPGSPTSVLGAEGKGALTVELGGWCCYLTTDFHKIGHKLKDAYINVMRHYGIIEGEAEYADKWLRAHQVALLAGASGIFVGEDIPMRAPIKKGTCLGKIYNLYGDVLWEAIAPEDGQVFGLRSRPMVMEGEWVTFFALIDEVREDITKPVK